jgi:hypothetical protein
MSFLRKDFNKALLNGIEIVNDNSLNCFSYRQKNGVGEDVRISPTRLHPNPHPFFCPMTSLKNSGGPPEGNWWQLPHLEKFTRSKARNNTNTAALLVVL